MKPVSDRAVARHVADIRERRFFDVRATVVSAGGIRFGSTDGYRVTVREDDGGELDLLFLGRPLVRGFVVGMSCAVAGRAAVRDGRLVVWNPRYRLDAVSCEPGSGLSWDEPARTPRTRLAVDGTAVEPAGRFRVYLGPAAGVGKTYAMLDEAQRRRQRGGDVVVATVDTHDRRATAAKLEGLEIIPPRTVEYRGAVFHEMDLGAVLARRPEVAVVDELAHTNVPGSGHEKRWQDVLELLAAEIGVITTLNVQHIESLADIVERVTGVAVRERVPDAVLQQADQIELVDSSPEQLRRRMLHGNIYPPDRAKEALNRFFRVDTLAVLRELTLRFLADKVDDALADRLGVGATSGLAVTERVLVAVTPGLGAETVLRCAARVAGRLNADLYAVHVRGAGIAESDVDGAADLRALAGDLAATWRELHGDPATTLMEFAEQHRITQIVVGRSLRTRWQRLTGGSSTVRRLTEWATWAGIDVHIVAREHLLPGPPAWQVRGRMRDDRR